MTINPDISIIIPVLDEAAIINHTLTAVRGVCKSVSHEIIMVDGNPSGNTLKAVADSGIRKIKSPCGRGIQMNAGAAIANGRILLFLHADTRLPENALAHILSASRGRHFCYGAFDLRIDSSTPAFRLIERFASARSRLTKIPYGDQAIFITKKLFIKMGGFKEIPIMEDIDLMRRLKREQCPITFIPEPATTSPRRWENDGIAAGTLRNLVLSSLFYLGISPHRLKKFYK